MQRYSSSGVGTLSTATQSLVPSESGAWIGRMRRVRAVRRIRPRAVAATRPTGRCGRRRRALVGLTQLDDPQVGRQVGGEVQLKLRSVRPHCAQGGVHRAAGVYHEHVVRSKKVPEVAELGVCV
ncbi:MAG: hypothetical protein WKH64_11955 [Chloroflexia bacterium]